MRGISILPHFVANFEFILYCFKLYNYDSVLDCGKGHHLKKLIDKNKDQYLHFYIPFHYRKMK